MPDILVRNLSDETVAALKARAKMNNRSAQAELAEIIESQVQARTEDPFWAVADRSRQATAGKWKGNSADIIREDRDSR